MNRGGVVLLLSGLGMAVILAYTARIIILNSSGLTDSESINVSTSFLYEQDAEKNVFVDKNEPSVKIDPNGIDLGFVQPAKGKVTLINVADENQNRSFHINSGKGKEISIPLPGISLGQWRLKFEWQSNGKNFFYEEDAFLK